MLFFPARRTAARTVRVSSPPASPAPPPQPVRPESAGLSAQRPSILLLAALSTVGPFSIDTFLPALPALAAGLHTSSLKAQQALSAYLIGFALMSLWHGPISDALGRRPVVLVSMAVYVVAAFACTFAQSIEWLIGARLVQGLSGGAGFIITRAIIRDCFEGVAAQRMLSNVMVIFTIAPAMAPLLGGYLDTWFGWRSVFGFMLAASVALWLWLWLALPETLGAAQRRPLHPLPLARAYVQVFTRIEFGLLASCLAFNFSAFFIYIMASPAFVIDHLKMTGTDFAWLFLPAIGGMMLGNRIVNRYAGRISARRMVALGYTVMGAGVGVNLLLQFTLAPRLAPGSWLTFVSIAPIAIAAIGQSMITPTVQIVLMDLFPDRRGMMSSCQGFTQVLVSAFTAGLVAPLLSGSLQHLVLGAVAFYLTGLAFWLAYQYRRSRPAPGGNG